MTIFLVLLPLSNGIPGYRGYGTARKVSYFSPPERLRVLSPTSFTGGGNACIAL
ncbi:MAG: hypothetical protein NW237_13510 [Cyanobacteriota bacterium]|nr:hypothetical protein [Cyanobacteriota bacterium]